MLFRSPQKGFDFLGRIESVNMKDSDQFLHYYFYAFWFFLGIIPLARLYTCLLLVILHN